MTGDDSSDISRRTFVKGVGAVTGATALGLGAAGTAAAEGGFDVRFANPRVREAAKVWEPREWRPGYRGRPDRTVALNDSGIDIRHPDVGGWNEVTAVTKETDDGDPVPEVLLTDPEKLAARSGNNGGKRNEVGDEHTATAVLGPGTTVEGSQTVVDEFTPPPGEGIVDMDATLSWTPQNVPLPGPVPILSSAGEDQSFSVQLRTPGGDWVTLQTIDTGSNPEVLSTVTVVPGQKHRFVAGQFANVAAQGEVTWQYYTYEDSLATIDESEIFGFVDGEVEPSTPKTVGWFDAGGRYGSHAAPADPDGHGSHVSGIMAGSGQASAVDPDELVADEPRTVLAAGDVLTFEVEAEPGTGVFGVATGTGVEVVLEGPTGETLRTAGAVPLLSNKEALPTDDARVDHPTVDERHPTSGGRRQPATYRVHVRPVEGEAASAAEVESVRAGAFLPADETTGDRETGDVSLHSGIAPNAGLVGLQGLSGPAAALGLYADRMAPLFNVRAVNMSWGGLVPGGGTVGGSGEERAVKRIAEGGILTCAAAGNNFGTVNSAPAIADEAVSVAATDYLDGVTGYSDGGAQAQDEDGEGTYGKPDVCAPGGSLEAGARAVKAKAEGDDPAVDGVRDYVNLAGTSMASPYVSGVATLVAQAMEEGAPDSIRLPSPEQLHEGYDAAGRLAHVMRLKSVLLSTASSTAFTAAPYHRHAVTYRHDGRDTYEGYGRVNPDAAVDAVTRDLLRNGSREDGVTEATVSGAVGLDVPGDSRAVAGYVEVPDGTLDVSLSFSHYGGGNKGMTKGSPWVDLFVYDAETPAAHGEPNAVASTQAVRGSGSVGVDVATGDSSTNAYFVVAKLVNVPGVVNGYDVQAHLDLDLTFEAAGFAVTGSRTDDGDVYTGGDTVEVEITADPSADAVVQDVVPDDWTVSSFSTNVTVEPQDGPYKVVRFDDAFPGGTETTRSYLLEAPSSSGTYEFGPAEAYPVGRTGDIVPIPGTADTQVVVASSDAPTSATSD